MSTRSGSMRRRGGYSWGRTPAASSTSIAAAEEPGRLATRRDIPEEPVRLVGGAGREEQRVRRADHAVAELQGPEAVDLELGAHLALERAEELAALRVEGVDLPVAEVADEQVTARGAEALRRLHDSPRGIERAARGEPAQQVPPLVEDVDEAVVGARDVVLGVRVLLRVADHDVAADRLDPERRVAVRELAVPERAVVADPVELPVPDVHAVVVEVGRVEPVSVLGSGDREALEDRALRGGDRPRLGRRRDVLTPGGDLSGLRRNDEVRRPRGAAAVDDELVRAVEDLAGGRAPGDRNRERELHDRGAGHVAGVKRGDVGAVVGHPGRRGRPERQTPGVDG